MKKQVATSSPGYVLTYGSDAYKYDMRDTALLPPGAKPADENKGVLSLLIKPHSFVLPN
jgi:hypothetical protein